MALLSQRRPSPFNLDTESDSEDLSISEVNGLPTSRSGVIPSPDASSSSTPKKFSPSIMQKLLGYQDPPPMDSQGAPQPNDQFGLQRPTRDHEGLISKILSYAAPALVGLAGGVGVLPGLASSYFGNRGREDRQYAGDVGAYNKSRAEAIALQKMGEQNELGHMTLAERIRADKEREAIQRAALEKQGQPKPSAFDQNIKTISEAAFGKQQEQVGRQNEIRGSVPFLNVPKLEEPKYSDVYQDVVLDMAGRSKMGPRKVPYKSPDEVKSAVESGSLDIKEAQDILVRDFGFEE